MSRSVVPERITIDIICSVLDGARYVEEFIRSLQAQTHTAWRLWVRDDGSSDGTADIVRALEKEDARVKLIHVGGPRLGVAGAFGWLLERVPPDSPYVMCGDADDVWLPRKIELELDAMLAAERFSPGPVLVHTDLVVVDADLDVIHPSFWRYSRLDPEPVSLRRVTIQNVTTAPTVMLNQELRRLIGITPPAARFQDWWYAYVAVAFGRIVALREATVLYRQHGANVIGARERTSFSLLDAPRQALLTLRRTARLRDHLAFTCRQAEAFASCYGHMLSESDRSFLEAYSRIPTRGFARRKFDLMRYGLRWEQGLWRNIGVLVRS